ncbi:altered inheritance of mitochondria protein 31, mitochondrial, partial [Amanita rubescens]
TPAPNIELWSEKFMRKVKQNPWVPLGAIATTATLVIASIKMRRGESQKMNHWLRARVAAQGFTILAICGGAYLVNKREKEAIAAKGSNDVSQESAAENRKQEKERREFEERLKNAEEAHRIEVQGRNNAQKPVSRGTTMESPHTPGHDKVGWLGWLGWNTSSRSNTPASTSEPSKERLS